MKQLKYYLSCQWTLKPHSFNIAYDKSKETESGAEKLAATQPSTMEETTDPRKLQTDVGVSDDNDSGEDYVDSEDGESSDNEVCRSVEL